jgi:organic radical activating enzyme
MGEPRNLQKTLAIINNVSPSFCAAKWYNASIWLGNGRTASCHHPVAHSIPLDELDSNPSVLHNTPFKKQRRKEMLRGIRPSECTYCWRVEDETNNDGVYSDRIYKSHIYTQQEIETIKNIGLEDVDPKTLEICFDNLCNLSCSYCNHQFSSTWSNSLLKEGPYANMITSGGETYQNNTDQIKKLTQLFGSKNENNPYIIAFFKWFHTSLKYSLHELRVSGGEPSRSPWFWKLLDECDSPRFNFAVNSNLIMDDEKLDRLIKSSKKFKRFDIYTSAECYMKNQEFVRNNFQWDVWEKNILKLQKEKSISNIHIMMTISALSVWTVAEFLEYICTLRKKMKVSNDTFHMSVNILRFPSFQSVNNIGIEHKEPLCQKIEKVLFDNQEVMTEFEKNQYQRLLVYLRKVDVAYEDDDFLENKIHDLKMFVSQYSQRNFLDIKEYMPENFHRWWSSI